MERFYRNGEADEMYFVHTGSGVLETNFGPIEYGPGDYVPNVFVQYWSMRVMAYTGSLVTLLALYGGWLWWRGRLATSRRFLWIATWAVFTPFVINTAGWMLTENGRQPWIVQGLQLTEDGVSPSVTTTQLVISLIGFGLLYVVLAAVNVILMRRYARRSLFDGESRGQSGG